jgi:hypothetical protein
MSSDWPRVLVPEALLSAKATPTESSHLQHQEKRFYRIL